MYIYGYTLVYRYCCSVRFLSEFMLYEMYCIYGYKSNMFIIIRYVVIIIFITLYFFIFLFLCFLITISAVLFFYCCHPQQFYTFPAIVIIHAYRYQRRRPCRYSARAPLVSVFMLIFCTYSPQAIFVSPYT